MWEVVLLGPVDEWFLGLCEADPVTANRVMEAIDHLGQAGPSLGRPMVDRVHGSRLHNLKELRPGSTGRSEIRLLFIFDAEREAVILVAGDKAGQWVRWYQENIPIAESRYEQYLIERKNEEAS
ncbi:type II toxin-antitoxin system RelE/ParE family toxin [Dactylosporangium salmoneum]|uniref:Type II toxin-antitoxin system RelE/ParE family toxin n=1 Tax=Dactylosporangium salmoneum TaxID=53361 RepID=A0ABP5T0J5_9ACTN